MHITEGTYLKCQIAKSLIERLVTTSRLLVSDPCLTRRAFLVTDPAELAET